MVTSTQPTMRSPRLNPFAFPSDTDFRFILLIVSVLGASLFIYSTVYFSIPVTRNYWLDVQNQCWSIRPQPPANPEEYANPEFKAAQLAFEQCRAPAERSNALWILGGTLILLAGAVLIYWTYPARKIRREHLVPLSAEDAPEVVTYLDNLCRAMKLPHPPVFLWNPLNLTSGGLAFGRWRRYYISLTGGLVTQFYTDLPAFRAILLHELAHLRNADVDRTYFAVAVWQAFLVLGLLPLAVTVFQNEWVYIFKIAWRVAALALLVYLMRNAVLRTREMYADVRASAWDGSTDSLNRVLGTLPGPRDEGWRKVIQVHPDPARRREVLEDPGRLFPMSTWDAIATGLAAAIALPNIITLIISLLTGTGSFGGEQLAASLLVAPLIVGVVGLGTWRTTFAALQRGEAPRGIGRLGAGLGLGILVGVILAFSSAIALQTTEAFNGSELVFNILWAVVLVTSLLLFIRWIAVGASAWLEVAAKHSSPRLFYTVGLIIAGGVLAIWLGLLFYIRDLGSTILFLLLSPLGVLLTIVQNPLTLIGLMSLWAFPLAARFGHRWVATSSSPGWAYLNSSSREMNLVSQPPYRLGLAVIIGLTGAVLYCGLLLFARIVLRATVSEAVRNTDDFRLIFYFFQIAGAAFFQASIAVITTIWVQRLRSYHGLLSAFTAGCIITVGILGLNLLYGGTLESRFVWNSFSMVINGGALLALTIVWLASLVAGIVHPMRNSRASISESQTA